MAASAQHFRAKWRAAEVYIVALLIFVVSRLVVVIGVSFGKQLVSSPDPALWSGGPAWYYRLLRWDAGWYSSIVNGGYRYGGEPSVPGNVVFMPGYPLVAFAVKRLSHIDTLLALLLVANIASLAIPLLLLKLVKDELGNEIALLSVAFLSFFPASLFLSAGYSEPLALAFVLLSFILLQRARFALASVAAAAAIVTRLACIPMLAVIIWEIWMQNKSSPARLLGRMTAYGLLAASGLLAYMAYLGVEFGSPLAFVADQAAWHGGTTALSRLIAGATLQPFRHFRLLTSGCFLCFLALAIWSVRRIKSGWSLYAFGTLLVPYFAFGIGGSMVRYALLCFPGFVSLAILCKQQAWIVYLLIGVFGALLLAESALFSQWYPAPGTIM